MHLLLRDTFGGKKGEVNRRMERIGKGFRGMGFVVHVVLKELFGFKMK